MENDKKSFFSSPAGIILLIVIALCCCCLVLTVLGGYYYYKTVSQNGPEPIMTPFDFTFNNATPTPVQITRVPVGQVSSETLQTLQSNEVPVADLRDLACRLEGKCDIPQTLPSGPYKVGDKSQFWVTNTDTDANFQVSATMLYMTDHAYFWVQDGVKVNQDDMKKLVDTFETKIYPTDRSFFGSEWTPGVDNDPHIYILYARGLGLSVAGYFSSPDEYPPAAHPYSNAHEMFVFNADNSSLTDQYTYGVLAHEFQHMIHWYQDRNETTWVNEGFSELAVFLNGYNVGGMDYSYIANTDMQLTDWNSDPGTNSPHYGASFLFMTYFLDRFGPKATQALVHDQQNGMESVDDVLKQLKIVDPLTGHQITANDFFMDWAVTNYLLDGSVGDGRYTYHNYKNAPKASETETISTCPTDLTGRTVHQYGVDYIGINCTGQYTLHFEGATQAKLIPVEAHSGKYMFWSNKGDQSDMTMTRAFDFSNVSGPLTLNYWTWYDVEKNYDYVFLEASTDGKIWQILKTPSGTDTNPSGNSYGWGYNATSNGWINEKVDLSQFAGKKVQIRFEYVTDAAVNGEGFLVDDISIPEINYSTDFESDDGGWSGKGFVRVQNALPETFRLALILKGNKTTVQTVPVNPDETADVSINLGGDYNEAVLVVAGTTPFTRDLGAYSVNIK